MLVVAVALVRRALAFLPVHAAVAEAELAEDLEHVLIERLWLNLVHAMRALPVVATDGQLTMLLNTVLAEDDFAVTTLAGLDWDAAADDALEELARQVVEVGVDLIAVLVLFPIRLMYVLRIYRQLRLSQVLGQHFKMLADRCIGRAVLIDIEQALVREPVAAGDRLKADVLVV